MDWTQIDGWKLFAGLGLFLFGMTYLEEGIKSLAGRNFKKFLQHQTGNSLKAVLAGALTTGIMQSSSVVILLVMSFTGAGIIGLENGVGMILGANIGTTLTGWLITLLGFKLNLESIFLPFTALGSILSIFISKGRIHHIGRLLFGFGLMFMGLQFMKDGLWDFSQTSDLSILQNKPWIIFVTFGFILAASIRSSSASVMIFLTCLSSGSITLMQAGFLVIGADLGTTVTGIIGTINGNSVRKKTGWAQFWINVITAIFTLVLIRPIFELIRLTGITDPLISLVTFHSAFNLLGILIILPFLKQLTNLLDKYISADKKQESKYLPYVDLSDSFVSIEALINECSAFILRAAENRQHFFEKNTRIEPEDYYNELKNYENEIFRYGTKLLENTLNESGVKITQTAFSSIRSAILAVKAIKDVEHNIEEFNHSALESVYGFISKLYENEKDYYQSYLSLQNSIFKKEQVFKLNLDADNNYTTNKEEAFKIYQSDSHYDLASMLNLIREIKDSRKLLLTAYEQYSSVKNMQIKNSQNDTLTK